MSAGLKVYVELKIRELAQAPPDPMICEYMLVATGVPPEVSEQICEDLELPRALCTIRQPDGLDIILYVRDASMPHELGATYAIEAVRMAISEVHGGFFLRMFVSRHEYHMHQIKLRPSTALADLAGRISALPLVLMVLLHM